MSSPSDSYFCEPEDADVLDYVPSSLQIGIEKVNATGVRFWTPNVVDSQRPLLNTTFDSLSHAWMFYKEYARVGGFEPIKSSQKPPKGRSSVVGGHVKSKIFTCAKGGKKPKSNKQVVNIMESQIQRGCVVGVSECDDSVDNDNAAAEKVKKRRKRYSKKCECPAKIKLTLTVDNKYYISHSIEEHNHLLVHPDYMQHLNAFRNVSLTKKLLLHNMNDAGVGSSAGHRILSKVCGSEDICFTKTDAKNFKRDVLAFIGDYDCQIVVELLTKKKESMYDFSFEYFLESDKSLGGFFWADEHAKRNYHAFGDVVSFDATYRTNKYDMVFIPFTGVDNHKRCVTFAAGMLSKENAISYKWLAHAFSKTYPNHPRIVLTDQDPAMKIAIESVFPSTRHRLCMWHITEKISSKVSHDVCNKGFKAKLSRIVWTDKLETEVFDFLWDSIIQEFGLVDNKWLSDMFVLRKYWVPAYFRYWEFSGLMRTSSRSESENHMFNQLMRSSNTLVEFLTHFDTAMSEQRFNQSKNDHESLYTSPIFSHDWALEVDASRVFTRAVFTDISGEIYYAIKKCMSLSFSEVEYVKKLKIVDTSILSTDIDYSIDREKDPKKFDEFFPIHSEVTYDSSTKDIACSCRRYERFGLLCRHIFYVLRVFKVNQFPRNYICKRWTKNVVPPKIYLGPQNQNREVLADVSLTDLIRRVYFNVEKALDKVIGNKDKLANFLKAQEKLTEACVDNFVEADQMVNKEFISEMLGLEHPKSLEIHNPTGIRNKGGGTRKRITSSRERAIAKQTSNSRKCSYCGSYDPHNIRTCPEKIEAEMQEKLKMQKNSNQGDVGFGSSQQT